MTLLLQQSEIIAQVDNLLSQMTLAQKIGQMTQVERLTCTPDEVKNYHIGSILSAAGSFPANNRPKDWLAMLDEYWLASRDSDKQYVGIPVMYGVDAIHGHNNVSGATIFPHNIALGASRNPTLLNNIAQVTAKEVMTTGVDWVFAPNLAVAQDCHWGRSYESYSEDPALVSQYAPYVVTGLQQEQSGQQLAACIKHWVGDGGTQHGIDQGNTKLSFQKLKNTHMRPYFSALEAGALSVMVSFSSWNGDKCHGSYQLITETLKEDMSFSGIVISDMEGIDDLSTDFYLAVSKGINAGIDVFMVPQNWRTFIDHVHSHVELGTISINRINDAVARILSVKFALGLFVQSQPSKRTWANHQSFGCKMHRDLAQDAVRQSLVLLKNDNNLLPLSKKARILVAGKNAHNIGHQCGGFTLDWQGTSNNDDIEGGTSIWQGIKKVAANAVLSSADFAQDANASLYDVAIVVIGEKPYAEGLGDIRDGENTLVETGSQMDGQMKLLKPYGNSLELALLHPEDLATIINIKANGIPVIVVLISGRTLIINKELSSANAFIAAWLPGSEGQGIADVIFGDYNFTGKLPFSWPDQTYTSNKQSDILYKPLFPYGFGLSYQHN